VKTEQRRASVCAEPMLVLLHIPKTAGTSLATIIHHHYGDAFRGGVGVARRGPTHRRPPNVFSRYDEVQRRLQSITERGKLRALAAHITFGCADWLPANTRYVTVLRDPVERTLSHYFYLVSPPKRTGAPATGLGLVPPWLPSPSPDLTLEECLQPRGYIPDNLQTRMLCGLISPYNPLPKDGLERAKANLRERFAYVGTTEQFELFLALLNLECGWSTVAYRRARANRNRPPREEVAADLIRVAEEGNVLDRELHAYAEALLVDALRRVDADALASEVEVLRQAKRGQGSLDPRELPVEARVALALKEAELADAELHVRRLRGEVDQLERQPDINSSLSSPRTS
jgi:hypothetical protein